jgi:hypothetical protein
MSSPKEAELQSPLPGNDANLLSLQETLLGCKSEMPGNLIFLVTIFSIMGVGLDQDEYLISGLYLQDSLTIFMQYKAFKSYYQIGLYNQMDKKTNQLTRTYINHIYDGSTN